MASEEDNFDIDVYGDGDGNGGEEFLLEDPQSTDAELTISQVDGNQDDPPSHPQAIGSNASESKDTPQVTGEGTSLLSDVAQNIASTDESATDLVPLPKQAPQTQGLKRKEGDVDDRYVDPNATTALLVSELHWWITDDDIRGWANQCQCEDELEDITFNEHKVNGKSKGYAVAA